MSTLTSESPGLYRVTNLHEVQTKIFRKLMMKFGGDIIRKKLAILFLKYFSNFIKITIPKCFFFDIWLQFEYLWIIKIELSKSDF